MNPPGESPGEGDRPSSAPSARTRPGPAARRRATFAQAARTVFWSFLGVRKRREWERDLELNPVHIVVMGLIGALVLVLALVGIVALIVRTAAR